MHRVVYLSRATVKMSDDDLTQLIEKAQERNSAAGLTGVVVHMQGRFLQVLEGRETAVHACFEHIRCDRRHTDIRVIQFGPVKSRAFRDWKIGLFTPNTLSRQAQQSAMPIRNLLPVNSRERGTDPEVRQLIRDFLASFTRFAAE